MSGKKLTFEVIDDYFHVNPVKTFCELAISYCRRLKTTFEIKVSREFTTLLPEFTITGKDQSILNALSTLPQLRNGEELYVTIDDSIEAYVIDEMGERIKGGCLEYKGFK